MRGIGNNTLHKGQLLISAKVFKVLLFMVCVQLTRNLVSSSVNSTIKITQISEKEDLGESGRNVPSSEGSPWGNLPRCGGIYSVRPENLAFRIHSPDYPLPYPSLLNCVYDIKFKGGSFPCYLDLYFEDFYLSSEPPDCNGDWLEIGRQRFCGGLSGIQRFATEWNFNGERHLQLNFVTDGVATGRGFKICVSQVPCNGLLPVPPLYPPPPPQIQPPPIIPPLPSPPFYPPWLPTPPRPPSYPPIFPPGGINLPLCCGTQYQGHHIHLISPGFPSQLPGFTQCGYVINRLNPRVTKLRIHFKYFFLPCPWESQSEGESLYRADARGYLNVDNRNICGCQTGLIITIPFGIFETRKVLRFYDPVINPLSRSQSGNGFQQETNDDSLFSNTRKAHVQFKASPPDESINKKSDNLNLVNGDGQGVRGAFRVQPSPDFGKSQQVFFPLTSHVIDTVVSTNSQRLTEKNHTSGEEITTSNTNSKSGRAFDSLLYNHPSFGPPLGFLLEVVQEEIPDYSARRGNAFSRPSNPGSSFTKRKTLLSPSNQNTVSRFFHLPSRSCQASDWPQVKWWLIWLQKKHLLQACPARVPSIPQLPFNPPLCDVPFSPISW